MKKLQNMHDKVVLGGAPREYQTTSENPLPVAGQIEKD